MDENNESESAITSGNYIVCMICLDLMGAGTEDLVAFTCGHVFHTKCMDHWTERSQSCPVCRANVTGSNIIKLFFEVKQVDIPRKIVLLNSIENMKFELAMMRKTTTNAKSELSSHKELIHTLRVELKQKSDSERQLMEMYNLEKERNLVKSSALAEAELKIKRFEKEIDENRSYKTIFEGTDIDLEEECKKGILTPDQLILCLMAFKKDLRSMSMRLKTIRKDYVELRNENESLKRLLLAQTSTPGKDRRKFSSDSEGSVDENPPALAGKPNFIEPPMENKPGPSTSKPTVPSRRCLGSPLSPSAKLKNVINKKRLLGSSSEASEHLNWQSLKAKKNTFPISEGFSESNLSHTTPKLKKCKIVTTNRRKPTEIVLSDTDDEIL